MTSDPIAAAREELDEHVRRTLHWHFAESTGSPFWLEMRSSLPFNPVREIRTFADLIERFDVFDSAQHLKNTHPSRWVPQGLQPCIGRMFKTGGTTGRPSKRWGRVGDERGRSDYADDYHQFSDMLPKDAFPDGGVALNIGPGGDRRLPRGIDILAKNRGATVVTVDMDVAWMKHPNNSDKKGYKEELVARAITEIELNKPVWVFCPPPLIGFIGEKIRWADTPIKGVFSGGTEMTPASVQNIVEHHFDGKIHLEPTFGNALAGLAKSRTLATLANPIEGQEPYSVVYQPFQPRTVIRVTDSDDPRQDVPYGTRGALEITTLTEEWFMPRHSEAGRDEAEAVAPTAEYPWTGLKEIGPPESARQNLNVGVY